MQTSRLWWKPVVPISGTGYRVSIVILPQGEAGVELEKMTAGSKWQVEVAQRAEAVEASSEAAAGMRGQAVSFRGEKKIER